MNTKLVRSLALGLFFGVIVLPLGAGADDTDIFIGSSATTGVPNVLFIIDNSSNWSSQTQAWPSGNTQGQAQVQAMKTAVTGLIAQGKTLNIGLMLITQNQGSVQSGGYVAHHVQAPTVVSGDGKNFSDRMDQIFASLSSGNSGDFNGPSSISWSPVLVDAYRYFGGKKLFQTAQTTLLGTKGTVIVDSRAYAAALPTPNTNYNSPVGASNICGNDYIVFIGNKWPNIKDTESKSEAPSKTELVNAGGSISPLVPLQELGTLTSGTSSWTTTCSSSQPATPPALTCPSGYSSAFTGSSKKGTCSGQAKQWEYVCTKTGFLGTYCTPNASGCTDNNWPDEWTRFMNGADVVPDVTGNDATLGIQNITTYTIDPYYGTRDVKKSQLLKSMADVGGGKYFEVTSEAQLAIDIGQILGEIAAKSSSFASASLPISAASRTQNNNQVFIGMFRPDQKGAPRWFGNLKQYELALVNGNVVLGDRNGNAAISSTTGFVTDCAVSEWTTDSKAPTAAANANSGYWFGLGIDPPPETQCTSVQATKGSATLTPIDTTDPTHINPFSDLPDGPFVEKGGASEVIRRHNDGGTSSWDINRNMFALVSGTFGAFNETPDGLKEWTRGRDVNDENQDSLGPIATSTKQTRPSLHGDVIHSRPLTVNYNTKSGSTVTTDKPTVVYYGSNDGTLRAVDSATGIERWAFVDYDAFSATVTCTGKSKLQRLMDNSPAVAYPNFWPTGTTPTPCLRDYFFDGSIGLYQALDNSKVWIYPTQRRGGAMVYAFDVSSSKLGAPFDSPTLKWRFGCQTPGASPCQGDATAAQKMGQSWATPIIAPVESYSKPIAVVGGGYDTCEDEDAAPPTSCTSASKGHAVFVLDADTGALIRGDFPATDGSVAADVSLIAIGAGATKADFGYAADTRGNIYRIDFTRVDSAGNKTSLPPAQWTMGKVAHISTALGEKFLFGPAVWWAGTKAYVAIGTGDREHPLKSEQAHNVQNRFYVFIDDLTVPSNQVAALDLDADASMHNCTAAVDCSSLVLLPDLSGGKGWYISLGSGEQTVGSALILGGAVAFNTNLPDTTTNACTNNLGIARGYWVNLLNAGGAVSGGNRFDTFVGGGLPPSPVVANVDLGDGAGARTIVLGAGNKGGGGKSSPIGAQEIKLSISATRRPVYWFNKAD